MATPSLWVVHMGLAGPHDMGTEFVRQWFQSHRRFGWSAPGLEKASLRPARGQGALWRGRCEQLHQQAERSPRAALN